VRGKAGRVFGGLFTLLVILKGLPLAYNRDLQEDKEPLFDTVDTVKACLSVLTELMPKIRFNKMIMGRAAEGGFSTATDLAEYLVIKGLPFREAHRITGEIVKYCLEKHKTFKDLKLKEYKQFSEMIDKDVFKCLTIHASINRKAPYGGTAKKRVLERIKQIRTGK
jgi:argininosuccinate lyase